MIISRTPLRVSFVGGGSDISSFYKHSSGCVVTTAIDKYIYIFVEKQFDGRIFIHYSKTELVTKVSEIQNDLVREALKLTGIRKGIHISSIADVPSEGTGMGSSSSYVVGLLNALYAFKGEYVSAERLAREACKIEIDILKKPIGKQDQYIAAYGGMQYLQFNKNGSVFVDPIICTDETREKLEKRLLLFYTGITRSSDPILSKQSKEMASFEKKRKTMLRMVGIAKKMQKALNTNNLDTFGKMLDENWFLKVKMADGITSEQINSWYSRAIRSGAIGGKLLGAGGGGFLLFYAPEDKHKKIIKALPELIYQKFSFEPQGSKIVFID